MGDFGEGLRGDCGNGDGGWVCLVDGYCGGCVQGADLVVGWCILLVFAGIVHCIFGRRAGSRHRDLTLKVETK